MQYTLIIEQAQADYSPMRRVFRAVSRRAGLHLRGMPEDSDPIPEPTTVAAVVEVAA